MLIDPNQYIWSKVPIFTFSLVTGEQLIDGGLPVRVYRIEGDATLSLYEDAEKTNLLYEGVLPIEFDTPISCDSLYVVCDRETTVDAICETGTLKADLTPYMNTTSGMTTLASGNDDGTYTISNTMDFVFNGAQISTIYVSSNNWYGFGSSTQHLYVMNRDGYAQYIRYQRGSLREGFDFLKIRYDGYTVYNSKTTANRLIYELFLLSNNDMFLNVIQTPTSSNTGTSKLVCGSTTTSLSLVDSTGAGGGTKLTFVANGEEATAYTVEYRVYQEPATECECYLVRLEDTYYTMVDGALMATDLVSPTPAMFIKYGFDEPPSTEILMTLTNPHLYYWRSDGKRQQFQANVTAEAFPQVITATADMTHESIIGIKEMTAQFSGTVMVQYSIDDGENYCEEIPLADFLNTDVALLWESAQETRRILYRFILYQEATLTSFRMHYTN